MILKLPIDNKSFPLGKSKLKNTIENTFEIQIPDDEVFYVMDFFIKNQPIKN